MGFFAVAALAGFLLFGWIKATPRVRAHFLKPWVQGGLGLLAFVVLAFSVVVLATQWPSYEVFRIVQDLTGTEAVQIILGAAFGCILRYWGPHFWEMRMRPGTRYNWVAISLPGLLLLATAAPYIGSLLRDSGVTGLKTPVAEFQFAGTTNVDRAVFEVERQDRNITLLPAFAWTDIEKDLDYLRFFQGRAKTIAAPCDKEIEEGLEKTYCTTRDFIKDIMYPLARCAFLAYENGLDLESIRHALSSVAQSLRLLIHAGQSQNQTLEEKLGKQFKEELQKSLGDLKKAILNEPKQEKKKKQEEHCSFDGHNIPPDLKFLTDAPHIYFVLARLDKFNDNRDMAISILKRASDQFGYDRKLILRILFHINSTLARYLYESEYAPEDIFPYLDTALEIAQDTRRRIEKRIQNGEDARRNPDKSNLRDAKRQFQEYERDAKNALAYFSAKTGVREFMALRYAEENYDDRNNLLYQWLKPEIIDTYGYVKMVFAARKVPADFDEIAQAKTLFQEGLFHIERMTESHRNAIKFKRAVKKRIQSHLNRADRLLASR